MDDFPLAGKAPVLQSISLVESNVVITPQACAAGDECRWVKCCPAITFVRPSSQQTGLLLGGKCRQLINEQVRISPCIIFIVTPRPLALASFVFSDGIIIGCGFM